MAASEGIEFLLDLQAKLDGAVKMIRELKKVENAVGKTDDALRKAENRSSIFGRFFSNTTAQARRSWDNFTSHLGSLAAWDIIKGGFNMVRAGIGFIVDLGSEMIHTAAAAERTELAFVNMMGADRGRETLGYLDALARNTEFTGGALKHLTTGLIDAGFAGDEFKRAMAVALDVAARSTNKMAGFAQAAQVLERVKLTGRVDSRALRALGIQGKDFFGQMAKDLKVSEKKLQKQLGAGKIKTEDILNSITKAMAAKSGRAAGAIGADMASTLQARLEKLQGVKGDLFESLFKTEGYQRLSARLGELAADLAPDGVIGSKIATALEAVFGRVATIIANVDWVSGIDAMIGTLEQALALTRAIAAFFGSFATGFERLQNWGERNRKWLLAKVGYDYQTTREEKAAELSSDPEVLRAMKALAESRARYSGRKAARLFEPGGTFTRLPAGVEQVPGTHWVPRGSEVPGMLARPPEGTPDAFGKNAQGQWEPIRPPSAGVPAMSAGRRPVSVKVNTPIVINVNSTNATAEEIAAKVSEIDIARQVRMELEQQALEAGYGD